MKSKPLASLVAALTWSISFTVASAAEDNADQAVRRRCEPAAIKDVRTWGELGTRYQAATCNLLTRTDRYSLDSFVSSAAGRPGALWWDWPGDQVGRWFAVLHVAEGQGWSQAGWHRTAVADVVLPHLNRDGHFGPADSLESDDARIPSGNAFALAGLLDAYRDTGDARCLDAARRVAKYIETVSPRWQRKGPGKVLHEFYGHCLDGLVGLNEATGDRQPLELAEKLAEHVGRTGHTHHSLSLCRGLIDLARVTGRREYLDKAEGYLAWCRENQLVTGGLPEMMPRSDQDEGCALADWIVVNLRMFELTGEDRYVDDAEHMLVNHFFMNQFHTGGFGHLGFDQQIVGGKHWQGWNGRFGSENPGCCSLWGQWALGQTGRYVATRQDGVVQVNLYAEADVRLPDRRAELRIRGDFPRMRRATIAVRCDSPQTFALALRVPRWADLARVTCDGQTVQHTPQQGRIVLRRQWSGETPIDVEFVSGPRAVAWPKDKPQGTALFDGPLCLALCSSSADVAASWTAQLDADGKPRLDKLGRPLVADPPGNLKPLAPLSAEWLVPDAKDPRRYRVLFQNGKTPR